ncbi:MAG TPA: hypothetical protein VFP65_20360 [Anaeromyxobacteraceae bacterium]|nr:hypothetical protein [Anaeromyxobacteraceae bacterium]
MVDVLERGSIAFVYRPRVQTEVARGIEDVQAFFVVLVPAGGGLARRVRVGRKRLPDRQGRERFWAYVDRAGVRPADVVDDLAAAEYWTKTRGLRHQPGPRLAGEGAYVIARHGAHVHLAYALRGRAASEVHEDLRIAPEASYVVAAFAQTLPGAAASGQERRFVPLEPGHLDVPGAEFVLIAAGDAVLGELEPRLERAAEDETMAELSRLVRDASGRPSSAPLLEGIWH